MNSIFSRLRHLNKDIDAIKSFLRLGEWARTHNLSLMDDFRSSDERNLHSKQFDYSATLSRLYFNYESFIYFCVREWVTYSLASGGSVSEFSEDNFFNDYSDCCGQALLRMTEQRFSHISKKDIVESLYGVLKKDRSAALIIEALVVDFPNLRAKTLASVCQRAQLLNFNKWLSNCSDLSETCSDYIGSTSIENALEDFVERRNAVSHGRFQDDNIYGVNLLLRLCEFVEMLCRTFAEFVSYNSIKRGNQAVALGVITQKYKNSSYLIEAGAEMLDVGREVYLCRETISRCYTSTVADIQLEGEPMLAITTNIGDLVGVKLSTPATKGCEVVRVLEIARTAARGLG